MDYWNIEQKKTYQILNPSYTINQKKYYKCINCNIQSDDPNLEGECRFHPSKISLKTKEATERILCGECGFEFTSINNNFGCKILNKHIFQEFNY